MWASQTTPEQVVSNLALWLRPFGLTNPPPWLRSENADRAIRHVGLLVVSAGVTIILFQYFNVEKMALGPKVGFAIGCLFVGGSILWSFFDHPTTPPVTPDPAKAKATTGERGDVLLLEINARGLEGVNFNLGAYKYGRFEIVADDVVPQTDGTGVYLLAGDDAGWNTVGYDTHIVGGNNASEYPILAEDLAANPGRPGNFKITLFRPLVAGGERRISFNSYVFSRAGTYSKREGEIFFKHLSEPITQVTIRMDNSKILSGVFRLYGRND